MFNRGAKLSCEKVYWTIFALRANHLNNLHDFSKATQSAPFLLDPSGGVSLPCSQEHLVSLRDILRDALLCTDEEAKQELMDVKGDIGYQNEKHRETLLQRLMIHNPKRRRLGIAAVRDSEGNIIYGTDNCNNFLGAFWGGTSSKRNKLMNPKLGTL